MRSIGNDATEGEIQERLPGCNHCLQFLPLLLVPASIFIAIRLVCKGVDPDSHHVEHGTRHPGEAPGLVCSQYQSEASSVRLR